MARRTLWSCFCGDRGRRDGQKFSLRLAQFIMNKQKWIVSVFLAGVYLFTDCHVVCQCQL